MRFIINGSIASRGLMLGRARLQRPNQILVDERRIDETEVEEEIFHLQTALQQSLDELKTQRAKLQGVFAREVSEFIDAHSMILEDPELVSGLYALIRNEHYRASAALKTQRDRLVAVFDAIDDPYLRSRREDIDQVIGRVQEALARDTTPSERQIASRIGEILISDSIAPAEFAHLSEQGVLGIVTTGGSPFSHCAILARSMHIPMVVSAEEALARICDDDLVLVDGDHGEIIVHPTAQDLARYRQTQRDAARETRSLQRYKNIETRTKDGVEIRLYANAELPSDVASARAMGAVGIGLYRTEFLFLQRRELPGEEEQFEAYRDLVLGMGGLPVTIRTLDLGADKALGSGLTLTPEPNPALGVRGIRLSMLRPALFATQLRAILRASSYGPTRILLPMVTSLEEIIAVRVLIDNCAQELKSHGHPFADHFELGAMIEVPAAAISLLSWIKKLDFVALGTNDLVQYTLATDRNNDALGSLYEPLHPAVLKLIAQTLLTAKRAGKPISLCGEMAGNTQYTLLLLALGLTDFSMHPSSLLEVRQTIVNSHHSTLIKKSAALLRATTRGGIERIISRLVL